MDASERRELDQQIAGAVAILEAMRPMTIDELGCDPRTGQRFAVGFTAEGVPYRAFSWGNDKEDGYHVAS